LPESAPATPIILKLHLQLTTGSRDQKHNGHLTANLRYPNADPSLFIFLYDINFSLFSLVSVSFFRCDESRCGH